MKTLVVLPQDHLRFNWHERIIPLQERFNLLVLLLFNEKRPNAWTIKEWYLTASSDF